MNLPPQDVAHLPEGGRGAEGNGGVLVGVDEPEDGHGGAEALAQPIAGLDRHPPVRGEGGQHLFLLGPQLYAQHLAGEGHGGEQRRGRPPLRLPRFRPPQVVGTVLGQLLTVPPLSRPAPVLWQLPFILSLSKDEGAGVG